MRDLLDLTDDLKANGEDAEEIDVLISQAQELAKGGKYGKALPLLELAKKRAEARKPPVVANKISNLWLIGGALVLILIGAAAYYIYTTKQKTEIVENLQKEDGIDSGYQPLAGTESLNQDEAGKEENQVLKILKGLKD
ncbi:MAG: hypothetical protein V1658_00765, partial [Candidatus Micrarchaeota archaeon]